METAHKSDEQHVSPFLLWRCTPLNPRVRLFPAADELAAALALPPADFRQRYGVPQPSGSAEDVVVLLSRSGRRAAWAAQLCVDAGLRR